MIRRVRILALAAGIACIAAPASAQVVHSLHLGAGKFHLLRQDGRAEHDVLLASRDSFVFELKKFNSGELFAEWLVAFNDRVEIGAGVGRYAGGTDSRYRQYTNGDAEIRQDLELRVVPITGLVRLFAGRPGEFQPYVGAGVSTLRFRYSQSGEFIDFRDLTTFNTTYTAKGTVVGPVAVIGFRAPVMGDVWGLTFELRFQRGVGKTGGPRKGFLDDRIDVGGNHLNFGWLVRF